MSTTPNDPTLEALAARVTALEQALASLQPHSPTPAAPPPASTVVEQPTGTRRFLRQALAAAASLVGARLTASSKTALAAESSQPRTSSPCVCSSDMATVPAVQATGTNGADGVDASSDSGIGLSASSSSGTGLLATSSSGLGAHVVGGGASVSAFPVPSTGAAIFAEGGPGYGVYATSTSTSGTGVFSHSDSSYGVYASSTTSTGVYGDSIGGNGVYGYSNSSTGVEGYSNSGTGVFGTSVGGYAGYFFGSVYVSGLLQKPGGGFQIDHPLDAAHKYLCHSFVESADMKNLYDGVVTLDANGQAEVRLPAWFEALNTEVRYQLTCLGSYAPVYIAEQLQNNRFTIAGGQAGMEVCWQLTGIRQDRWATAHRLPVEQDKPANEQGYYLHPDLYGEPEEKSIHHARFPDLQRPAPPQN